MNTRDNTPRPPLKPRAYTPEEAKAEVLRRYEEYKRNPEGTTPAEEVFAEIRRKLRDPS